VTDSDIRGGNPMTTTDHAAVWGTKPDRPETWQPVTDLDGCSFSRYQVSDKGRARNPSKVLSCRAHKDGYVLVSMSCDHKDVCPRRGRHTFTLQKVVLTTFTGPRPAGQEACHSPLGPACNWWPEGVRWGTKPENHRDMREAGNAVIPEPYPCRNHERCGQMVKNPGRRCVAVCVPLVARHATEMLDRGMALRAVADRFGYKGTDWLYRLAVDHGYTGTREQAARQSPRLGDRVALWFYLRKVSDV